MTPSDVFSGGAVLVALGSLLMSWARGMRMQGADRQRLDALEERLTQHASTDSVNAMGGRLDELESDMKHVVATVGEVSVVKEKVMGLDRLMTRELDEIKHTLRRMEERTFAASPMRPAT